MSADDLVIGGFLPYSTVDWPGQIVATMFLQGCPWQCSYCHNQGLIPFKTETAWHWKQVRAFLERRTDLLDGIVFSGGEPTSQPLVVDAIKDVCALGFRVGVHTGGANPQIMRALLPMLDWVGFDIKTVFEDYARITGNAQSGIRARESFLALLESGVAFDARTTFDRSLLTDADADAIRQQMKDLGVGDSPATDAAGYWRLQTHRLVQPI